ncbi:glycosyltransferase family 2 protein [Yunchengibacter salinarum]|uniref:glycosyltransferase family 2 protein n=1 Tax=Yunchengibacter salinarum TaxID=3133399 RepID=UPI0035B5C466
MARFGATIAAKSGKFRRDPIGFCLDSRVPGLPPLGQALQRREARALERRAAAAHDVPVSVIMTVWRTGDLAVRALKSLMAQTHPALEILVIDDAGGDDTARRLVDAAAGDPRVRLFQSPRNRGTYWCKNWCLARATGRYVAFHDSDDISRPQRIALQLAAMEKNPTLMGCTCKWRRRTEDGETVVINGRAEQMAAISLMIRREPVLARAGYFDCVRISADTEYLHRLRRLFGRGAIRHLRQPLYEGLYRAGSLTTGPDSGFRWQPSASGMARTLTGDRARYDAAFRAWHAATAADDLYLPFPPAARPFDVPDALIRDTQEVDTSDVRELTAPAPRRERVTA